MPSDNYSFLDVAVLDDVRRRFASGDAIAILSADLEQVIWANGPGANVFGYPDIEAVIGASAGLPPIARRQIMATSGFPEIGRDRSILVRLATGMSSRAVGFLATAVTMPDGEKAIVLTVPAGQTGSRGAAEIAGRAISGFTEDGHFIAFVDGTGGIEAASDGFLALGIAPQTLAALVADVAAESDRIVKRMVPGEGHSYPAGLARLTDEPARHLLVVIDEDRFEAVAEAENASAPSANVAAAAEFPAAEPGETAPPEQLPGETPIAKPEPNVLEASSSPLEPVTQSDDGAADEATGSKAAEALVDAGEPFAAAIAVPGSTDHDLPNRDDTAPAAGHGEPQPAAKAVGESGAQVATRPGASAEPTEAEGPGRHDQWYFNSGDEDAVTPSKTTVPRSPGTPAAPPSPAASTEALKGPGDATTAARVQAIAPSVDRSSAPVRFVWRTDAEGRFNAISAEFAETVGKAAADIIGRKFKDVAAAFGLDPSGEIAGLLERRDTWSGRSVLWPVAGTDLTIPVDLAALPVYGRSRAFEGFRGFGVARTADAIVDPEAIGLALVPNGETPADQHVSGKAAEGTAPEAPKPADPFKGEVPALSIVPKPERRFADKVIRLAEHRQPANDKGLSTLERTAFREIGERLKKESSPDSVQSQHETAPSSSVMASNDDAKSSNEAVARTNEAVSGADGTVSAPAATAASIEAVEQVEKVSPAEAQGETAGAEPATFREAGSIDTAAGDGAAGDEYGSEGEAQTAVENMAEAGTAAISGTGRDAADAETTAEFAAAALDPEPATSPDETATAAADETVVPTEDIAEAGTAGAQLDQEATQALEGTADAEPPLTAGALVAEEDSQRTVDTAAGEAPLEQSVEPLRGPATQAGQFSSGGPTFESTELLDGGDALFGALATAADTGHTADDAIGPEAAAASEVAVAESVELQTIEAYAAGGQQDTSHAVAGNDAAAGQIAALVDVPKDAAEPLTASSAAVNEGSGPDDDSMVLADISDAEDQEDLSRLDGEPEAEASAPADTPTAAAAGSLLDFIRDDDGPTYIAANSDDQHTVAQYPANRDDAGRAETDGVDTPAANESQAATEGVSLDHRREAVEERVRAEEPQPRDEAPAEQHTPAEVAALVEAQMRETDGPPDAVTPQTVAAQDDDSMAAADLCDARDDEAPAGEGERAERPNVPASFREEPADAALPAPVFRPRLAVPPLKTSGFVPSAFSSGPRAEATDTSILDKLPIPLLIHSGDVLHYANEEFLDLTGYDTLEDLERAGGLGALFADPYADDNAPDGGDRTLRLKTQDELEFPIGAILRSVPWRGGKALMLVVRRSGEDEEDAAQPQAAAPVQPLAEAQQQPDTSELKARIAEMRTIIDTATDGVVLIGRDGTIRSISRPAEALFGFDSDEVAGKPFASLFAIESQRAARDYLTGLSEHGVASVLNDGREVIGREAQGRFIPLFMTIGRLPNDSGFCAVVRDITQWKRAEEDLTQARAVAERASSQKTDFLARISHEIRTPLNAIIGFSELMVDEKFGPVANDRYRDYLRDINRSGNHVLDLVNDLLDISKIEAGQQEMDYEAVSLNDTLGETVAMMQPQANRERVIIRSSFASKLPEVVADLRSVRQIALNILSNAIRYTQAGGQVIVSTAYEPSGDVVMRVRDTGIGMSQAEIEQALKPFKQINALKRGRGDGTGLGLPLTKAMVEANRARFTINSTPGEGTLVEISFPSTRVLAG